MIFDYTLKVLGLILLIGIQRTKSQDLFQFRQALFTAAAATTTQPRETGNSTEIVTATWSYVDQTTVNDSTTEAYNKTYNGNEIQSTTIEATTKTIPETTTGVTTIKEETTTTPETTTIEETTTTTTEETTTTTTDSPNYENPRDLRIDNSLVSSRFFNFWPFFQIPTLLDNPLTVEQCKWPPFNQHRSCQILNQPADGSARSLDLENRASQYLCSERDRFIPNSVFRRSKRHTIHKRSINTCQGHPTEKIIYRARDAANPLIFRDVVLDPVNHLYQTIFVEQCTSVRFPGGWHCGLHDIIIKAAVWDIDPASDDIEVIQILVKSYCALSLP